MTNKIEIGGGVVMEFEGTLAPTGPPQESYEDMRKRAFDELRATRAPMLNAVSGIVSDALAKGNEALAEEGVTIRQRLLDVTLDPALQAAITYEAMKVAGQMAYRIIAKSVSAQFAAVFRETTGA